MNSYSFKDGFNYRAWHYKCCYMTKTGSHFVEQNRNKIDRVSLIIQYSKQVLENKEQLANLKFNSYLS